MTGFDPIEHKVIDDFHAEEMSDAAWSRSRLRLLRRVAPSTKGRFARQLVRDVAAEGHLTFESVRGRRGNRCRVNNAVCEIKFSMESPARFQQVRLPDDGYSYLIGIAAQPEEFVYWVIPALDVRRFIDTGDIEPQHADTSLWFRAELAQDDAFSEFRFAQKGFVETLAQLTPG
jgi:hypothetical protein